jgi:hypothetical protein
MVAAAFFLDDNFGGCGLFLDAQLVDLVSSSRVSLARLVILTSQNLGLARLVFLSSRVESSLLRVDRANELQVFLSNFRTHSSFLRLTRAGYPRPCLPLPPCDMFAHVTPPQMLVLRLAQSLLLQPLYHHQADDKLLIFFSPQANL